MLSALRSPLSALRSVATLGILIGLGGPILTTKAQQADPNIGLPMTALIGSPTDIGTKIVQVEDFSGDDVPDYLVGVPHAVNGQGVLVYVQGPPRAAGWRVSDVQRVVRAPVNFTMSGLGGAVTRGCDLNMDGRREIWSTCSIPNQQGVLKHSLVHFDPVTLRVTFIAADVPAIETVWNPSYQQSPNGWAALIAPFLPLNLNDPRFWTSFCPTCSGGEINQPGTPQNSSNPGGTVPAPSIGDGFLKCYAWVAGSIVGGNPGEAMHWYSNTNLTLSQTMTAADISKTSVIMGEAVGIRDGERAGNAARHAYWQMMLSKELGEETAARIADIHEGNGALLPSANGRDVRLDSWVDYYNNARGRELLAQCQADGECTDQELFLLWLAALTDGTLITDPECDLRVPSFLQDCNHDGFPDAPDCDLAPGVHPILAPRLDIHGYLARKADINADGFVTLDDVQMVLDDLGDSDFVKDQNGDCEVWVDDAVQVLQDVDP